MNPELISELSSSALIGVLLVFVLKYLTKDLSQELHKQYEIICDLIKAKNQLTQTINDNTNEITDSLNRIEGMIDAPPPPRPRRRK